MAKLKPLGKIAIAAASIIFVSIIASLLFPLIAPEEETAVTTEQKLHVILVGRGFDSNTLYLQEILTEIEQSEEYGKRFTLSVIDTALEPEKAEALGMKEEELPCYVIGTEKHCVAYGKQWFELKIREQSDILRMSKTEGE